MGKQKDSSKFDFNNLFIFEVSKNHAGNVDLGIRLVKEFSKVAKDAGVRAAIKLQFLNPDTYIHPTHRDSDDPRMRRYFASRLSEEHFGQIVDEIHSQGLVSMSTPFDEESVGMLDRLGVEVIKIASASATDWPLLERIVQSKKPVVCSVGGLSFKDTDILHDFFKQHGINFAFLHCVSMYPTPMEHMQLGKITAMKKRYPEIPIGLSTHAPSENLSAIQVAHALGAELFEKHVAIPDENLEENLLFYKIKTYTITPEQAVQWLAAHKEAVVMCGSTDPDSFPADQKELETLRTMMRGVYVRSALKMGDPIKREDVYFSIPLSEGQVSSGEWRIGLVADRDYAPDEALFATVSVK
ncbi:MAG: N-acetylneuraminate synthase family protein [Minisyncoccia bacterium]